MRFLSRTLAKKRNWCRQLVNHRLASLSQSAEQNTTPTKVNRLVTTANMLRSDAVTLVGLAFHLHGILLVVCHTIALITCLDRAATWTTQQQRWSLHIRITYKHLNSLLAENRTESDTNASEAITRRLVVKSTRRRSREGPRHFASTHDLSTNNYDLNKNLTTPQTASNFKRI
jgi:hypothetical protein